MLLRLILVTLSYACTIAGLRSGYNILLSFLIMPLYRNDSPCMYCTILRVLVVWDIHPIRKVAPTANIIIVCRRQDLAPRSSAKASCFDRSNVVPVVRDRQRVPSQSPSPPALPRSVVMKLCTRDELYFLFYAIFSCCPLYHYFSARKSQNTEITVELQILDSGKQVTIQSANARV